MFWLVTLLAVYVAYLLLKYHQQRQKLLAIRAKFGGPESSYFLGTFYLFKDKSIPGKNDGTSTVFVCEYTSFMVVF